METAAQCRQCGKPLHGRTDKRFCNDDCRNSYNRAQRRAYQKGAHPNIPAILKTLQKNHEILRANGPEEERGSSHFLAGNPGEQGINTKFYTSIYHEGDQTWYCCFDYGWNIFPEGKGWGIRHLPEQAAL